MNKLTLWLGTVAVATAAASAAYAQGTPDQYYVQAQTGTQAAVTTTTSPLGNNSYGPSMNGSSNAGMGHSLNSDGPIGLAGSRAAWSSIGMAKP